MGFKSIQCHIRGVTGLVPHSSRLANPLEDVTRELRKFTGKRKKTDEDYERIAQIEWQGGVYVDDKGRPCVPGENIEAMLVASAKETKSGKKFLSAVFSDGNWPLTLDTDISLAEMSKDRRFRLSKMMKVQQTRILRTRPIFWRWELKFTIKYHSERLDADEVVSVLRNAGEFVGLMDSRPKFGRFEVVSAKEVA